MYGFKDFHLSNVPLDNFYVRGRPEMSTFFTCEIVSAHKQRGGGFKLKNVAFLLEKSVRL